LVNTYFTTKVYILYLHAYLLNIDIDIDIRQYRIDIVLKSKK